MAGSVVIGDWHGAPIHLHWSVVLGGVIFTGFHLDPVAMLAFPVLVLLHEIGHAVAVERYGGTVLSLHAHIAGGHCVWSGDLPPVQRSIVAWGGVIVQAIVLAVTMLALKVLGPPTGPIVPSLVNVATAANLAMIAINLIPIPPLDGAEAWRIIPRLWNREWKLRPKLRAPARRPIPLPDPSNRPQ
jgi:stage IV sporulation protein FB